MGDRPFRSRYTGSQRRLALSGVIDELELDELRSVLERALIADPDLELEVDLTDVDFLPSVALGVLVGARKRGHRIRLEAEQGSLAHRVLTVTGLMGAPDQNAV